MCIQVKAVDTKYVFSSLVSYETKLEVKESIFVPK